MALTQEVAVRKIRQILGEIDPEVEAFIEFERDDAPDPCYVMLQKGRCKSPTLRIERTYLEDHESSNQALRVFLQNLADHGLDSEP
ncbi:MAG: hypothetical protein HY731_07940 [Candidatus Tectomicrobia bacterium]|nr:hypothetical protein [Candidatus Tectomicrobia bacterium]